MGSDWCSVSAPASARLMGEHAVLRGGPAIVFTLTPRMRVRARLRQDHEVHITSKFGKESFLRADCTPDGVHSFVKAALLECPAVQGVDIEVISEFEHTVGLGSSAAVTVAAIGAFLELSQGTIDKEICLQLAQKAIRVVQGEGSGADAAASVYGGVLLFYAENCSVTRLVDTLPLFLSYSGMKTPTKEVIAIIRRKEKEELELVQALFQSINHLTKKAVHAIVKKDLVQLGACLNEAHGCMVALGLENRALASLRGAIMHDEAVLGCKISGSGLGDCLVALSEKAPSGCLPVRVEAYGIKVEA